MSTNSNSTYTLPAFTCGAAPLLADGSTGLNALDKFAERVANWYYKWSGIEPRTEEDEPEAPVNVTAIAEPTILEAA